MSCVADRFIGKESFCSDMPPGAALKFVTKSASWLKTDTDRGAAEAAVAVTVDPFRPNETLLLFEKTIAERLLLVVPAERLIAVSDVATENEAVIRLDPDIPKVTPLEFEKTTVPLVAVWVPAAIPPGAVEPTAAEAVTTDPFNPNETPFAFEKVTAVRLLLVVPAEILMLLGRTDAVIVDPFRPKLTPLLFEKMTALRLLLVVPAEKLTAEMPVAVLASASATSARRTSISLSGDCLTGGPLEAYGAAAEES